MNTRREEINVHRMQFSLAKKLTTPNKLTSNHLAECLIVAHELDASISRLKQSSSLSFNEIEKNQQDILETLRSIDIKKSISPVNHMDNTTTKTAITGKTKDDPKPGTASHSKAPAGSKHRSGSNSRTTTNALDKPSMHPTIHEPHDDISSSADLQTLLLQQKNISAREIAQEEKTQQELTSELLELTSLLKENTIVMNETIQLQNTQLTEMYEHAEDNVEELDEQKEKMNKQQQLQSNSLWTTVYALITVFVTFTLTYVVIRLFPKPR
mmetsp:Transcript_12780/g.23664  ORF Transcript_12780/g.23664 Transcript_12780/m.23664 type:complete len:269 (+) Transcript_12780:122-928(+)